MNKDEIYQVYLRTKSFRKTVQACGLDPALVRGALMSKGVNLAGQGVYRRSGEVFSKRHVTLGASITMLRLEKGHASPAYFAKLAGMSPKKLTMIERGIRDATFSDLLRIADTLEVPLSEFTKRLSESEVEI